MKITIDTKEDSAEDIKKVIKMLSSLIGEDKKEDEAPEVSEGVFNMFDSSAEEKQEEEKPFELKKIVTY